MWASGDFPRVSRDTVAPLGPALVEACGVSAGQRVLDVAAGAGNAALRAAARGADVVASDLVPELLEAGRAEARARGLTLEWREADAEALPFPDASFDVVMSCMGAMFAPDHQRVADELVRVARPGAVLGMINATPGGWVDEFFRTLAPFAPPPPPGARPPVLWGSRDHLETLFGDRVTDLRLVDATHEVEAFATPAEMHTYYQTYFGPVIAAYAHHADRPETLAALDEAFLSFAVRTGAPTSDGRVRYPFDHTLVTARVRPAEPRPESR